MSVGKSNVICIIVMTSSPTLELIERDEAGNITSTYAESESTHGRSRVDVIVRGIVGCPSDFSEAEALTGDSRQERPRAVCSSYLMYFYRWGIHRVSQMTTFSKWP
jgi:hypothetical protein